MFEEEPLERDGEDFDEDRERVTVERDELPEERLLPILDLELDRFGNLNDLELPDLRLELIALLP